MVSQEDLEDLSFLDDKEKEKLVARKKEANKAILKKKKEDKEKEKKKAEEKAKSTQDKKVEKTSAVVGKLLNTPESFLVHHLLLSHASMMQL